MTSRRSFALTLAAVLAQACAGRRPASDAGHAVSLDAAAETYVKLVLALGQHDRDYVDAYYGPSDWAEAAKRDRLPLAEVGRRAAALLQALAASAAPRERLVARRRRFLQRQVHAVAVRVRLLSGESMRFDEESEGLYGARAPIRAEAELEAALAELGALLPGSGALAERLHAFRQDFMIPPAKLERVLQTSIAEARRRTKEHIPLPADESVTLELVTGETWDGYNWYRGDGRSLVQVNSDLPITISHAIDVAAHESYPGHHVYNLLLEQRLVRQLGWVEFAVYPLYSPQSLIAEGSATYGVHVVFPDETAYLRDVLFPLAGLPAERVEVYLQVEALARRLRYADIEAARRFLDGQATREQTRDYLVRYRLLSPPQVERFLVNAAEDRTYVINYSLGHDLVADFIARKGGTDERPGRRWELLRELLSSPCTPEDLRTGDS
ncbi:hypothetical protein [Nannocystis punicea]|uniref:DUF885 domain-containing protein n=1 Tax=Nannocystis punicea TaxID=2995304 RepID=A0ABY7GW45_9BACT|nr:hypothetical protein [Nannocystis poenicansa]WAS91177.1 hypothetical protein O0S08_33740 [Nannocystis poenicansa]